MSVKVRPSILEVLCQSPGGSLCLDADKDILE
jgi:hypothetical protein